jgi:hypothetical protein
VGRIVDNDAKRLKYQVGQRMATRSCRSTVATRPAGRSAGPGTAVLPFASTQDRRVNLCRAAPVRFGDGGGPLQGSDCSAGQGAPVDPGTPLQTGPPPRQKAPPPAKTATRHGHGDFSHAGPDPPPQSAPLRKMPPRCRGRSDFCHQHCHGESRGRDALPRAPRTDPYVRLSRIRFPPRVLTIKLCSLTYARQHQYHALPGSESGAWVLVRIPLGPCPSLHRLRHSNLVGSALFAGSSLL